MEAVSTRPPRWNHNLHYHRVILAAVPDGARRSLDVGCGVGMLARDLRRVVPHVTAIDRDAASIDVARREDDGAGVEYVVGDFMTHPFEPGSFDHIASIAALHHMDAGAALERMRELLAPGGTLAIVGLARPRYPADLPFAVAGARRPPRPAAAQRLLGGLGAAAVAAAGHLRRDPPPGPPRAARRALPAAAAVALFAGVDEAGVSSSSARRLAALRGAYCRIEGRRVAAVGRSRLRARRRFPAGGPRSSCALRARFATPSARRPEGVCSS